MTWDEADRKLTEMLGTQGFAMRFELLRFRPEMREGEYTVWLCNQSTHIHGSSWESIIFKLQEMLGKQHQHQPPPSEEELEKLMAERKVPA